jgi:hypothetical protein
MDVEMEDLSNDNQNLDPNNDISINFKRASFYKKKEGEKFGDYSFMKRKVRVNTVNNDVKEYSLD